jgi:hypothetical protein
MRISVLLSCAIALLMVGCASTGIGNRQVDNGPRQPRPTHVVVYDFAVSLDDMPGARATNGPDVGTGDLVITGYFQELNALSRARRMTFGFGKGQAEIANELEAAFGRQGWIE